MGVTYINPYMVSPFSPANLAPSFWVDADDASTITASGGLISQWNDKSTNAKNLVQGTGANQPSYVTNVQNSRAVVRAGLSRYMASSFGSANQPVTIFSVIRVTSSSTAYRPWIYCSNSFTGNRIEMFTANGTFFASTFSSSFTAGTASSGSTYIVEGVFNGTSSSLTVNAATTTGSLGTTGIINAIWVGRNDSNNFQGDFCEVLVFTKLLTVDETTDLRSHLNTKWAVY